MLGNPRSQRGMASRTKKYYAVFAGNAEYPLAVFAATGKRLSGDDQRPGRHPGFVGTIPKQKICGNAFSSYGWVF